MKRTIRNSCALSFCTGLLIAVSAQAVTRTWDGTGDGANWTDTLNWNPDGTPGTSDDIIIGSSATVTNAQNSYKTLDIQIGANVKFAGEWAGSSAGATTVSGTLGRHVSGVMRLGGTMNLNGHLATTINFLDMQGRSINFTDGVAFDNTGMGFEHKGNNAFSFKISPGGFKTVTAGFLYSGNNGSFNATWTNITYNVDFSDYDIRSGLRIVLMDFTGHDTRFNTDFNAATVNLNAGSSGLIANLSFETSTSSLVLTFPYPLTWNGNNSPNWLDRLNWTPTNLPTVSDNVLVKSGASITNGQSSFATLEIQTNATVKLSSATGQSGLGVRTLKVAGTLSMDAGGVLRMNGAALNLSGHLGSGITWLDMLSGTITFTNGAAIDNSSMSFEHKGWNTFNYVLGTNGFTTLVMGSLYSGNNAAWSNATYNINVSPYTGPRAINITLADYSGHSAIFNNTFNPKVTITGHDGGSLSFDTTTSKLILRVYGPKGTMVTFL